MFNTLLKFGAPFDFTSDAYWIEPSKSYKRTKEHAAIMKVKIRLSNEPLLSFIAAQTVALHKQVLFFDSEFLIEAEQMEPLLRDRLEQVQRCIPRNDHVATQRFILFAEEAYHTEFRDYLMDGNKRILTTWLVRDLNAFTAKQSSRLFPNLKIADPVDFHDLVRIALPEELVPSFTKIINYIMAFDSTIPNTSVYCNVLLQCFNCLHNKVDIADALKAAWLVSYNSVILEDVFGLVLSNFRELLADHRDQFPFLNHAFISLYFNYLDDKTENGISNYDNHLIFETFKEHILPRADALDPYNAFNSVANYINRSHFNLRKVAIDQIVHGYEAFQDIIKSTDEKASSLLHPTLSNDIPIDSLLELKEKLHHLVYLPLDALTTDFSEKDLLLVDELKDIEEKAKTYAHDPLANIDALNALSTDKKILLDAQDQSAASYLDSIKGLKDSYLEITTKHNHKYAAVTDDQAALLQNEVETFRGLLHDAESQIELLTQSKRELTEQLKKQTQTTVVQAPKCDVTFDDLIDFLDKKNPCLAIVQLIVAKRPWVKISDSLLKSLADISLFSRPAELARYLLKLTSEPFIESFQSRGSLGAFEYFSKSTLTFKESETTMKADSLRRQREFYFQGKKILCEPHLKISINNTEQHQLRIHFSINDGNLYLGYIGRHLPIA